jgi:predicted MFS family arabinose efflux permease
MSAPDRPPLAWPEERERPFVQGVQVKRWGMRMLAFLALAFVAAVAASAQGRYNALTALLLLIGLPGAAICTIGGLRAMYLVPPDQRARGRSQR